MENRRGSVVLRRAVPAFAGHGPGGRPAAAEIVSSQGGDAGIAPSTGLARGCRRWGGTRFRGLCRAGVFARRLGLAASQGFRDDAGIVPCECRVWSCCTLKDTHAAKRQCTPQSASPAITGLRSPHHAAHAEACLHSATAALPRSGKDRSGERLAPAGAVSEANRAAGPALRPEIGRSYAFYRRTGDNKRSDGRLPHEKQLSPPQAALDSAAPYRGAFQTAVPPKPPLQGEVDAPQGADGGVRRPALPISFRAGTALTPAR